MSLHLGNVWTPFRELVGNILKGLAPHSDSYFFHFCSTSLQHETPIRRWPNQISMSRYLHGGLAHHICIPTTPHLYKCTILYNARDQSCILHKLFRSVQCIRFPYVLVFASIDDSFFPSSTRMYTCVEIVHDDVNFTKHQRF